MLNYLNVRRSRLVPGVHLWCNRPLEPLSNLIASCRACVNGHDRSLRNETKWYIIDIKINFVRQRRNKWTGWGRRIYMRINFIHLGDMLILIYICSQHKARKVETVETSEQRAERLEVLSKPKQQRLKRRKVYNEQSDSRCWAKQSIYERFRWRQVKTWHERRQVYNQQSDSRL